MSILCFRSNEEGALLEPSGFRRDFRRARMSVCKGTRVRLFVKSGLFSLKKQPRDQTFGQLPKCAVFKPQVATNRDSVRIIISLS